jgi:hypothetical protein
MRRSLLTLPQHYADLLEQHVDAVAASPEAYVEDYLRIAGALPGSADRSAKTGLRTTLLGVAGEGLSLCLCEGSF